MAISTPETWGGPSVPTPNPAGDGDRLTLAVVDPDPRLRTRLALQLGADHDVVIALIEHSDDIVMVAGLDIPNIKNTKLGLQTLRLLEVGEEKITLLLNRADSKVQLDVAEVERTLAMRAGSLVPSDIAVPQSVNKG